MENTVSDTFFSYNEAQWALEKIQAPEAWEITTGSASVKVGVIDSGIANHPDLNANLTTGWDFVNENSTTTDDLMGHGTHVAGIIGATGTNANSVSGVAKNVTLVPLQILRNSEDNDPTDDTAFHENLIEAINYATTNNIPILNFSGGCLHYDIAIKQAIVNYPGLFVCAAGSLMQNLDEVPRYPASYKLKNLISVTASKNNDAFVSGTDDDASSAAAWGVNTVNLAAPGDNIYSTHLNNSYLDYSGTSMATPLVTGVAALIKSLRPDLSATQIKALILDNVDKVADLEDRCITGGRLNAYKAVRAATEPQTFTGDVNGDGKSDVILSRNIYGKRALTVYKGTSNGSFEEPVTTQSTYDFSYQEPAFVGDFNGDGRTDVVVHWSSSTIRQLLVYIGKSDGTFYEGANLSTTRLHNPEQNPCTYHIADVNGDNKDDFIVHYRNSIGNQSITVYKGTSVAPYFINATGDALITTNAYVTNQPAFTGDFNGDGYADLAVHRQGNVNRHQLLVYTGTSTGSFSTGGVFTSGRAYMPQSYSYEFFIDDMDGDGKDDFIIQEKGVNNNRVLSVFTGTATSPYFTGGTPDALYSSDIYNDTDFVTTGDTNGDGLADVIVQRANENKKRQLLVYSALDDLFFDNANIYTTSNTQDPTVYAGTFLIADVNGDGKDDFIVKWRNGTETRFLVYRGTNFGSFSSAVGSVFATFIPYYDAF